MVETVALTKDYSAYIAAVYGISAIALVGMMVAVTLVRRRNRRRLAEHDQTE